MAPTATTKKRKANHSTVTTEESESTATVDEGAVFPGSSSGCSTPKAERFRIPELCDCPPAPKRRRRLAIHGGFGRRRRPIKFFTPPDLELFFHAAIHNVSV
ncbi:hypothetical protein QJS04_geneDACA010269 [Acorus gramineus]|uniref:Uncharacterized protein n=1 Tax=Acorus gramineus TaxID=55184 RepID=A0AAV9A5S9_ACOGR|nr:hypothetical protein QJS04_geneDACA010269 [Acorus gramineus]